MQLANGDIRTVTFAEEVFELALRPWLVRWLRRACRRRLTYKLYRTRKSNFDGAGMLYERLWTRAWNNTSIVQRATGPSKDRGAGRLKDHLPLASNHQRLPVLPLQQTPGNCDYGPSRASTSTDEVVLTILNSRTTRVTSQAVRCQPNQV
jgi:hypothetical protein